MLSTGSTSSSGTAWAGDDQSRGGLSAGAVVGSPRERRTARRPASRSSVTFDAVGVLHGPVQRVRLVELVQLDAGRRRPHRLWRAARLPCATCSSRGFSSLGLLAVAADAIRSRISRSSSSNPMPPMGHGVPVNAASVTSDGKPDDVEDLGARVARNVRDAHLRHDLQDTVLDHVLEAQLRFLGRWAIAAHFVLGGEVGDRLEREPRRDRLGPVAEKAREVVDLARLARLDDQRRLRPKTLRDESLVDDRPSQVSAGIGARSAATSLTRSRPAPASIARSASLPRRLHALRSDSY